MLFTCRISPQKCSENASSPVWPWVCFVLPWQSGHKKPWACGFQAWLIQCAVIRNRKKPHRLFSNLNIPIAPKTSPAFIVHCFRLLIIEIFILFSVARTLGRVARTYLGFQLLNSMELMPPWEGPVILSVHQERPDVAHNSISALGFCSTCSHPQGNWDNSHLAFHTFFSHSYCLPEFSWWRALVYWKKEIKILSFMYFDTWGQ